MAGVEAQAQVCLQEEIASAAERGRMEQAATFCAPSASLKGGPCRRVRARRAQAEGRSADDAQGRVAFSSQVNYWVGKLNAVGEGPIEGERVGGTNPRMAGWHQTS